LTTKERRRVVACAFEMSLSKPSIPSLLAGVGIGFASAFAFNAMFKKKSSPTLTPATAWPSGKPAFTPLSAYPDWDSSDKKGSFMKICDMLIAEVRI